MASGFTSTFASNIVQSSGTYSLAVSDSTGLAIKLTNKVAVSKFLYMTAGSTASGMYNGLTQVGDYGLFWGPDSTYGFIIGPNRNTAPTSQGTRWDSTGNINHNANLTVASGFTTSLQATSATTLSTSGSATLNSLIVNGSSTLNSNTYINTTSGSSSVGLVINNSNPSATGSSTTGLLLTQGNYGCQLQGILTQGVGGSFNLSVGSSPSSWSTVMSGNSSTLTIASTTTQVNNLSVNNNGITFNSSPSGYTTSNIYQSYYNLNVLNSGGTTNSNANINFGFDSSAWKFIINTGFAVFKTLTIFDNGLSVSSGQTTTLRATTTEGLTNTGNITNSGDLINNGNITTNNNTNYGTNSTIITTKTTLSWPLNRVIFVNATTTSITVTLPTLTSANDGLSIVIRCLPTCTQNVAINLSSSQLIYLDNSTSLASYNMINTSPVLRLTAINNYWMQI